MKKKNSKLDEIQKEYDFSKGVRGKHYKNYREGHLVRIHKKNGSVKELYFSQEEGSIMLDPDVKSHFPDSDTVNKALRALITQN